MPTIEPWYWTWSGTATTATPTLGQAYTTTTGYINTVTTANIALTYSLQLSGTTVNNLYAAWAYPYRPAAWSAATGTYHQQAYGALAEYHAPTPAEVAAAERRKKRAVAKAKRLLREHLEAEQLDRLATDGYFEVTGSDGKVYRIYRGISMNVVAFEEGEPKVRLCAHSGGKGAVGMPAEDHILIQKLALETDAAGFLAIANRSAVGYLAPASPLALAA